MDYERAIRLRRDRTEVEKRLWHRLRNRQLAACKFKRQAPIGRYVVDFACFERGQVVELDGGQHASTIATDAKRTAWLGSQGFRVMRFWNSEVVENMEGVLETILSALGDAVPPHLPIAARWAPSSPTRGEEDR